jgi:cytoskeletal protein RodZ
MMTVTIKSRKRIFNICARVKKRDRQAKRREEKSRGENAKCGSFSSPFFLSLFLPLSLSVSVLFWIFGKVMQEEKEEETKKKTKKKKEKMIARCPDLLSTKIDIVFQWLHLTLCHHLLGI